MANGHFFDFLAQTA